MEPQPNLGMLSMGRMESPLEKYIASQVSLSQQQQQQCCTVNLKHVLIFSETIHDFIQSLINSIAVSIH